MRDQYDRAAARVRRLPGLALLALVAWATAAPVHAQERGPLVLATVGVPPEGIAVILGVDRILDMCRTTVNVCGDLTAAVYVARAEGEWDPRVVNGFVALNKHVGSPTGRLDNLKMANLYFLWSVERVGMLYGRRTIADKEWYPWGTDFLLKQQQGDGPWWVQDQAGNQFATHVLVKGLRALDESPFDRSGELRAPTPGGIDTAPAE